jgi:hypothetical protein
MDQRQSAFYVMQPGGIGGHLRAPVFTVDGIFVRPNLDHLVKGAHIGCVVTKALTLETQLKWHTVSLN